MKSVAVKKAELIKIIKENREKHHAIFIEALEGWKKECIKELSKWYDEAKSGRISKTIFISIQRPEDHTREYDRALKMLEMEVGDTVTISADDFQHLVQDDWEWKHQFLASNSRYSATATSLMNGEEE